jgi:O-glycosyl hydrolase
MIRCIQLQSNNVYASRYVRQNTQKFIPANANVQPKAWMVSLNNASSEELKQVVRPFQKIST